MGVSCEMAENEDYICVDCSRKSAGGSGGGGGGITVAEENVVVLATSMCGAVQSMQSTPVMASWSRMPSTSHLNPATSHEQQHEPQQGS